ncbi:hypothetical protein [Hymenobacter perfusus]|uniref:Uncharacterized protein n=1 Tax=Hymenobacter perfusus TaxID=1236770 RepID=A0A3R9NYD5_9BACT|nr:hypothetical protein [Hymenobacter perfusus]RSK44637.1 hypothetical protein EI293_08985 [Hymenobacter perfusus]
MAELMRLRLPAGWAVCYNSFGDEDMVVKEDWITNFHYYKEDLLWLEFMRLSAAGQQEANPTGWLVDLGWYPDGDPSGAFSLVIFRLANDTEGWPEQRPTFRSSNRYHIRTVLEYILHHLWIHPGCTQEQLQQQLTQMQQAEEQNDLYSLLGTAFSP